MPGTQEHWLDDDHGWHAIQRAPRANQRSRPPFSKSLVEAGSPRPSVSTATSIRYFSNRSRENPVLLFSAVAPERLRQAANDHDYLTRYDEVMARFDALLTAKPGTTWVGKHQSELIDRPVAYFSAEFGVHPALPIYSGGLGVLAGDHAKAASDLGLPLVGVSLLYRQGYLRQRLTPDGWQLDVTPALEPGAEPIHPCSAPTVSHSGRDRPQ